MRFRDRRFYVLILVGRIYLAMYISEGYAVLPGNGFRGYMYFQQTAVVLVRGYYFWESS